jgi:predicted phage terminase large subunit-like protein
MKFLLLDVLEALYGGAAGGGKTDALLMAAVMYVDKPRYSAILFRDTLANLELSEGLIERSHDWGWEDLGAKYNGSTYTWAFPSGAKITFGYMNGPNDHLRYKSTEWQYAGWDQVEDIRVKQYEFMFSRLRRLEGMEDVPLRVRATANPGGLEWVEKRFVNEATRKHNVVFIPATMDENDYLDRKSYERSLQELDPITYQQMRNGIWGLRQKGAIFDGTRFKRIPELPYGKHLYGVRYWDLAGTEELVEDEKTKQKGPAYTVGTLLLTSGDGDYYVKNVERGRWSPATIEARVAMAAARDQQLVKQGLVRYIRIRMEQEPGQSGKAEIDSYARRVLQGYEFSGDKVTGSKFDRARPWASAVERGAVYLVEGKDQSEGEWIEAYIREHEAFPEGEYKDQVDSSSGCYNTLNDTARTPKVAY